jgi:hypothetical protein
MILAVNTQPGLGINPLYPHQIHQPGNPFSVCMNTEFFKFKDNSPAPHKWISGVNPVDLFDQLQIERAFPQRFTVIGGFLPNQIRK